MKRWSPFIHRAGPEPSHALTEFRAASQEAGVGCRHRFQHLYSDQSVYCESEAFCQASCPPNKVWFFQKLEELGEVFAPVHVVGCGVMYHCMHVLLSVKERPFLDNSSHSRGHQSALASNFTPSFLPSPPRPIPLLHPNCHRVFPQRFLGALQRSLHARRLRTRQKH